MLVVISGCLALAASTNNNQNATVTAPAQLPANFVRIKVQIIPDRNTIGTNRFQWQVQVSLNQQNDGDRKGYTSISNKMFVANNNGQLSVKLPVQLQQNAVHHMAYRVTCLGGSIYNDKASQYITADQPERYDVSLNMIRRQSGGIAPLINQNPPQRDPRR